MIYRLKGIILEKRPNTVIIDVGGVGYEVGISLNTFSLLGLEGSECIIYTHMVSREDSVYLFGFLTIEEKKLFLFLTTVSGIGSKMALKILSGIGSAELKRAVISGDHTLLSSVPGIGKKTAERIIVELKDKFDDIELLDSPSGGVFEDVISALINLGYKSADCKKALEGAPNEASFESLLKYGLANMSKK